MRVYQKHAGDDAKLLIKFHWPYKTAQNLLICNAHDKTKIFIIISVWKNSIATFILIGARTTSNPELNECCYFVRDFVPGFYWEYTETYFIKNSRILECRLM